MSEVEEMCDRVLFLSRGKILLEGDPRRCRKSMARPRLKIYS